MLSRRGFFGAVGLGLVAARRSPAEPDGTEEAAGDRHHRVARSVARLATWASGSSRLPREGSVASAGDRTWCPPTSINSPRTI